MKKFALILLSFLSINLSAQTTEKIDYSNPKSYEIGGIMVKGADNLNNSTLITISGLTVGENITIPSDNISQAILKLWKEGLFSDVDITIEKIVENTVFLNINLVENSRLSKFKFKGKISKSDITTLKEDLKLMRGKILTQNLINNSTNLIKTYYINKGFLNVSVGYLTTVDSATANSENLIFNINKGKKVKIKEIKIIGRSKLANTNKTFLNRKDTVYALSDKKVRKSMKETKAKNWWRIFKVSKFIDDNYIDDKAKLIAKYNEVGYRDARITNDTTYLNKDNTLSVEITINEGEPYKFGKINFVGNKVYSSEKLKLQLGIKEGDVFDQSILDARLFGSPDGNDISSLYLDDGYLFFNATPVEVAANNRNIDLEIRIYEGKQARVNKVMIKGNTKTNDHVIMREIRTRPGDLFKRSDIMRSQRELSQMAFFDPEAFDVKVEPDPARNEVDITYVLAEKSASQIQLQGGWGANRIVGSLNLVFDNFSTQNILNRKSWKPLPSGDGQRLALTASSNGAYYQNYNISFTEPWLGGKKPNALTVSLYKSVSSNGQDGDNREAIEILGLTVGLGKRLKYPDDYFTIYNGINFQQYKLVNSQSFFTFKDGFSNNVNYNIRLGRNSVDQLIFPRRGSNFSLSLKVTPPFSLFDGTEDYSTVSDQEKFKFIEYYKWKYKSSWYSAFTDKLVLATKIEMGLLGAYNNNLGVAPFERFYVGGDGLSGMGMVYDGRELISLRGYSNNSISPQTGGTIYNKYTAEMRYALSLNPSSTIYALGFMEAGNAWDNFDNFNPFGVKRSAGFGVRIMLPMIGMMGLDYGWGLDDIAGRPDANGGQFHFSIGQQF
ncbi:MAG: outer membrane protein assembly factor BamA [Flavobacteriales bacterium]|mgnify:FL=1|nr:outer membrane protein assembly factor BamA [Flavobacteriales bacterium]MBT4881967.1 outer membrane protein assembly factor BamA [Flavobacteriales bacterium]